jgi:hypothetical protein
MGETSFPHVPPSGLLCSRPDGITALAQQVGLRDGKLSGFAGRGFDGHVGHLIPDGASTDTSDT